MTTQTEPSTSKFGPIFDLHPVTGIGFEVFYADGTLPTLGGVRAGWFWLLRPHGSALAGPAVGPFPTSYSAYRDALDLIHDEGTSRANFGLRPG
jgi:hypothetical protein